MVILSPATDAPSVADLPDDVDFDFLTLSRARGARPAMLRPVSGVLTVTGVLVAMATAVLRHRRSTGADRDRMRWLVWAVVVMALTIAVATFADLGSAVDGVIVVVAVLPVVAMTVGVVRPTVVPVENLLVRTLVLGAVASCLLGARPARGRVALPHAAAASTSARLVTVVLLVTALGYGPLRHRLHRRRAGAGSWAAAATGTT